MSLLGHEPVWKCGATVWVVGRPAGGAERLARRFVEGGLDAIGAVPGPWALVARVPGDPRLWVAVDAFAGVPLFVRDGCASLEPEAFRGAVDAVEVRQHLDACFASPWRTLWEGVWRVPAGSGGALGSPDGLRRIYRPRGSRVPLRWALQDAVDHLVPSKVRLALSGGLDSSALAACLRGRDLELWTLVFEGCADERRWARAVAARLARPLVERPVTSDPFDIFDHMGPFPPVLVNHHLLLPALEPGITLVTGFGGDEVLGHGFDVVRERMARRQPLRGTLEALALGLRYRHAARSTASELGRWLREAARAWLEPPGPGTLRERRVARFSHPLLARSREEQLFVARRRGARIVMPYLDPRVVAAVVELPASARVRWGQTRNHLRRAMGTELPRSVRRRTHKADLSSSFHPVAHGRLLEEGDRMRKETWLHRWIPREEIETGLRALEQDRPEAALWLWRAYGLERFLLSYSGT